MKSIFLVLIKLYQAFMPKQLRGRCLFKESCSNYVYRLTREKGFIAGKKALRYRIRNCKPNYFITENNGKILLVTAQNEVIEEKFISKLIIEEFQ